MRLKYDEKGTTPPTTARMWTCIAPSPNCTEQRLEHPACWCRRLRRVQKRWHGAQQVCEIAVLEHGSTPKNGIMYRLDLSRTAGASTTESHVSGNHKQLALSCIRNELRRDHDLSPVFIILYLLCQLSVDLLL